MRTLLAHVQGLLAQVRALLTQVRTLLAHVTSFVIQARIAAVQPTVCPLPLSHGQAPHRLLQAQQRISHARSASTAVVSISIQGERFVIFHPTEKPEEPNLLTRRATGPPMPVLSQSGSVARLIPHLGH